MLRFFSVGHNGRFYDSLQRWLLIGSLKREEIFRFYDWLHCNIIGRRGARAEANSARCSKEKNRWWDGKKIHGHGWIMGIANENARWAETKRHHSKKKTYCSSLKRCMRRGVSENETWDEYQVGRDGDIRDVEYLVFFHWVGKKIRLIVSFVKYGTTLLKLKVAEE